MTLTDLLLSQLLDPFRLGLIVALLYTAIRNQAATGMALPLAAGVAFVAIILPTTIGLGAAEPLGLWAVVGVGVVANAILLALAYGVWQIARRFVP